ncbi:MAG: dockerin type I domain-containing protein [Clostridia bacterium]
MKKIGIRFLSIILIFVIIFTFVQVFLIKKEVYAALSTTYTQYIKSGISNFPESYQKKLAYLKYLHPNWEFKAYYTGISWDELVSTSAENACMKNTIHKGSLLDPAALCKCGQQGDVGYYDASNIMVRYYLDPRNFLGEAMVFQFLDLSNGDGITRENVLSATRGTYLEQYTDDIMRAASEAKINPLHIVATIFQELGDKTGMPSVISGNVQGYEGYYNFYNYGATDGGDTLGKALQKAISMGWNSPSYALIDGAKKVLANNYISVGQTTKYFYKFDVVGTEILTEDMGSRTYNVNGDNFYGHQYMTNLRDPSSQAGALYDIYADNQILDSKLIFTIPVYNDMPDSVSVPTSLTSSDGELYYINSLKKYGIEFRTGPGSGYASLGNVYKDTVVARITTQGAWSQVKLRAATTFNTSTKQWNYETKTGWVSSEYLAKVGVDIIPDYRGQVDMGTGGNVSGSGDIKLEDKYLKMTPEVTVNTIKSKYSSAVIKDFNGIELTDTSKMVGTGYSITIDGKAYTGIKYGDVNGDGLVKAADYVFIKNFIMDSSVNPFSDIQKIAGDVNKDGNIRAADYVLIKNYIMTGDKISL